MINDSVDDFSRESVIVIVPVVAGGNNHFVLPPPSTMLILSRASSTYNNVTVTHNKGKAKSGVVTLILWSAIQMNAITTWG